MINEIGVVVTGVIVQCAQWFTDLLNACDAFYFWLSGVFVWLSYKFLLAPIFGHAKSDMANKAYRSFKNRKEK